jgi:predicted transcriptional regulator
MALSQAEVATKLNAEYVAGNLIVGERGNRVFVGKTSQDGVFTITEEGEALLAALETVKPATKKATKAEAVE